MAEITDDATDDPADALRGARTYLATRPVEHNVAHSLLSLAAADRGPGRYWTAARRGEVVGFAMQYPRTYRVALTPIWPDVVASLARAIAAEAQGAGIPGVVAEAGTAAAFAGCWSELAQVAITVDDCQRLYRLGRLRLPAGVPGMLRRATTAEARLLNGWWEAFSEETGSYVGHAAVAVERGIAPAGFSSGTIRAQYARREPPRVLPESRGSAWSTRFPSGGVGGTDRHLSAGCARGWKPRRRWRACSMRSWAIPPRMPSTAVSASKPLPRC